MSKHISFHEEFGVRVHSKNSFRIVVLSETTRGVCCGLYEVRQHLQQGFPVVNDDAFAKHPVSLAQFKWRSCRSNELQLQHGSVAVVFKRSVRNDGL